MTTVEQLVSFGERVEESASKRGPIDWRRVFLALLSALPFLLGRVAGDVMFCMRIMAAAAREGYRSAAAPKATAVRPTLSVVDR